MLTLASMLLGTALGAIGWLVAKFIVEPFKEIGDLRREAQAILIVHGNLSKDAPAEDRRATSDAFRRVGAAFVAHHLAGYRWTAMLCGRFGWDIHSAGELLIGIGNATQFDGFSMVSVSPNIALIRDCLKLPAPETPPMIRALQAVAGAPGTDAADPPLGA